MASSPSRREGITGGRRIPSGSFGSLAVAGVVVIVLPALVLQSAATDSGRIGVLYIGGMTRSPPFWYLRNDLLFSLNFVLATLRTSWASAGPLQQADTEEAVKRMVRLYMPRTYSDLTSKFDAIVLSNANRDAVGLKNIEMLARGVEEAGMSLFMDGGMETLGGTSFPPWGETAVGKLLPTEDVIGAYVHEGRFVISQPENELMSSLPWETKPVFGRIFYHNLVVQKPGSDLLAYADLGDEQHPAVVTWKLGQGARTFVWAGELHKACMRVSGGDVWEYCTDLGANILIYLVGRPVPQDIDLVHRVRTEMFRAEARKSLIFSLLDFAEDFGANTQRLVLRLGEVDGVVEEAGAYYLDLHFEETLEIYATVDEMLTRIEEEAVGLKNRALFWVYVIEWLAVAGVSMICGLALWAIMIRRRLYREVKTTRLGEA